MREKKVITQGTKPIVIRRREIGSNNVITIPKIVNKLVKVADEYQLDILENGDLLYKPKLRYK